MVVWFSEVQLVFFFWAVLWAYKACVGLYAHNLFFKAKVTLRAKSEFFSWVLVINSFVPIINRSYHLGGLVACYVDTTVKPCLVRLLFYFLFFYCECTFLWRVSSFGKPIELCGPPALRRARLWAVWRNTYLLSLTKHLFLHTHFFHKAPLSRKEVKDQRHNLIKEKRS